MKDAIVGFSESEAEQFDVADVAIRIREAIRSVDKEAFATLPLSIGDQSTIFSPPSTLRVLPVMKLQLGSDKATNV